jgi:hypothetical protein
MATKSMAQRVNASRRSRHALRKAGYTKADVENVTHIPMTAATNERAIRIVEQTRMDWYGGMGGGTLVNRTNSFALQPFQAFPASTGSASLPASQLNAFFEGARAARSG